MLSQREIRDLFEQLRSGLVPERGLDAFAVGVDKQRRELHRQLERVQSAGSVKFLRGGYGCGKTFMARLAVLDAQARNFATSFVVVSDNDLRFHRFEEVYRKVVAELGTRSCPRGALRDILDRWIGRVEEELLDAGADENAPDFDVRVRAKLDEQLANLTGGKAPPDFIRVVQTVFDLEQAGERTDAAALLSWLAGSQNIAASVKRRAGIKGDIRSSDALAYLRGILEITKAAGYQGLLVVIDEAETILRMRKDSRHKSLNGIRQISDAAGDYPGLLWLFTGTPDFFDSRKGVAGLAPLHDRIRFLEDGEFASLRQPQLLLRPFDDERLRNVAIRLRELYPSQHRDRLLARITDRFIDQLVTQVTEGFRGDVGVVPRQFLRELIEVMDRVEDHDDYIPSERYGFDVARLAPLSPAEQRALAGQPDAPSDAYDDEPIEEEQVW